MRCRITIALVKAAPAINSSAAINLVVKGSRPAAAMGVVRAVMISGEKKNMETSSEMLNPVNPRQRVA
jgi:hypothetical protein